MLLVCFDLLVGVVSLFRSVSLLVINDRVVGVVALHIATGSLKTRVGADPESNPNMKSNPNPDPKV